MGLNEIVTNFQRFIFSGISVKHNTALKKLPLGVFHGIPTLKSLQIVELPTEVRKNLSLSLENLEQLRLIGSSDDNPILPAHFLQDS